MKREKIIDAKPLWNLSAKEFEELDAFHTQFARTIEVSTCVLCGIEADLFIIEEGWSENYVGKATVITANHEGNRYITMINYDAMAAEF